MILCWPVYVPMFLGRSGPGMDRQRQDPSSRFGIVLQYAGSALIWIWRRPLFTPLASFPMPLSFAVPAAAVIIAIGSVWFSRLALKTLGRQWSFVAGVTSQHKLIQEGPYAVIRHPLYACFFALTLATGMVWAEPLGLLAGSVVFWIGVWIRVRTEENLLRETFGLEFERYVKNVPAFFPMPRRQR